MEQTVYADILFLINLSMDYLCFYINARLFHCKLPPLRALIASGIGGLYSVLILFSSVVPPLRLVCDVSVLFLMCFIVFLSSKISALRFIGMSASYVGVCVGLGGAMTAIFNLLNSIGIPFERFDGGGDGMPVWLFAIIAVISGGCTLLGGKVFQKKQSQKSADVEIIYSGHTIKLRALCDSGNLLRDPISGKSVVLTDVQAFRTALPEQFIAALQKKDMSLLTSLPEKEARSLCLVPSRNASGSSVLFALKPDKLTVFSSNGSPHEVEALFAPITLDSSARGFSALLPPELLI